MMQHIIATISPLVESRFPSVQNYDDLFSFFEALCNLAKVIKGIGVIYIPAEYRKLFMIPGTKMKIIYDSEINTKESNVLFQTFSGSSTFRIEYNNVIQTGSCTNVATSFLEKEYVPFFCGEKKHVFKLSTSNKKKVKKVCDSLTSVAYKDAKSLFKDLQSIFNDNLSVINTAQINENGLVRIAVITAFLNGATLEEIKKFDGTYILENMIGDIKTSNLYDLQNIAFSAFRSVVYPSCQNKLKRVKLSIDWHPEDGKKYNDVLVYRVDVVDQGKSGCRASGRKRLLRGDYNNCIGILAFSTDHDFSDDIKRSRTKIYREMLAGTQKRK